MTGGRSSDRLADYVAAWATGVGIGVGVFMVTWLVSNRITAMLWAAPTGPVVAMALAVIAGITVSIWRGWRLSRPFVPKGASSAAAPVAE